MWWVYIIRTERGPLYTGITTDIERRFKQHKSGKGGAKFFRGQIPGEVVFREMHPTRSSALKREASIKRLTRREKLDLISQRHV